MDVIALPYRDGVSVRRGSLMAALAHGCAIITTNPQVDTPELVGNRHVRLVPAESPTALALAIEDLAKNPELRADMGRNAAKLAADYSWEAIAARTAAFYQDLIDQAG